MNFVEGRVAQNNGTSVFDSGSFSINLPERLGSVLEGHSEGSVTLGIRPQYLYADGVEPDVQETATITAQVDLVEPMGSETFLYLSVGDANIVARAGAHIMPELGAKIEIGIDMTRAHFFDDIGATIV